jgi:putative flavoprotein involved in K+ transport
MSNPTLTYDTIVIGGGQAGLATGYYLRQQGRDFVILDANERIGDSWRDRWDSLRLFTPARYNGLPGMPFPAPAHAFPAKDDMADYLEAYAAHFELPVRTGVQVDRLSKPGGRFVVKAGDLRLESDNVVVAMATFQKPRVPPFARELDPGIVQLHSSDYRNLSQLQDGGVLVVGAGNSGSEIALEAARRHPTWMSGRHPGHVPFRIEGVAARLLLVRLVLRVLFHRVLTVQTPMGRKLRPKALTRGGPLIRVKPEDLAAAGVERVPRTVGVRDGLPVLEDGRVLDVANVVWCTGFHSGFSWIDLPVLGDQEPMHERGVVAGEPGLYFVGLNFLYALSSTMIHGVGRDARRVARAIANAPVPARLPAGLLQHDRHGRRHDGLYVVDPDGQPDDGGHARERRHHVVGHDARGYPGRLAGGAACGCLAGAAQQAAGDDVMRGKLMRRCALWTWLPLALLLAAGLAWGNARAGRAQGLFEPLPENALATGFTTRYAGRDAYERAVILAQATFPASGQDFGYWIGRRARDFGWGIAEPGHNFTFVNPDAWAEGLAGSVLSHRGKHGPILLVQQDSLPEPVRRYLDEVVRPRPAAPYDQLFNHGSIVGGSDVISPRLQGEIDGLLRPGTVEEGE